MLTKNSILQKIQQLMGGTANLVWGNSLLFSLQIPERSKPHAGTSVLPEHLSSNKKKIHVKV